MNFRQRPYFYCDDVGAPPEVSKICVRVDFGKRERKVAYIAFSFSVGGLSLAIYSNWVPSSG